MRIGVDVTLNQRDIQRLRKLDRALSIGCSGEHVREEEQHEEHDAAGDAARCGMGL